MRIGLMNKYIDLIKNSELIKGFFSSTIWGGLSKAIAVLITMYCSNKLSQEGFGEYSFIRNTLDMILVICATNFSTLAVKFAAESIKNEDSLKRLILLFEFTLFISVIACIIILAIPQSLLESYTGGHKVAYFMRVVGLCMPVFIVQPLISAVFRGYKRFNLVGIYETCNIVLYFGLIITGIHFYDYQGAIWALIVYYLFYSVSGIIALWYFNKKNHYIKKVGGIKEQKQSLYKMILPIFLMSFVEAPLLWMAQAEIGRRESYALVGSLSVILTIRYMIQIIPTYFYQSFIPHVTTLNSDSNYQEYFRKFKQVAKVLLLLFLALIPLLLFFGEFLLSIFNKTYTNSYSPYVISILIMPLLLYSTLFKLNLMILEHQVGMLWMTIISSICFLLFFYLFGFIGVNMLYAFFYAQAVQFGYQLLYSLKVFYSDQRLCLHQSTL